MGTWWLDYADGSANAYHVSGDGRFEYVPVTPERSSTGMYSGGDPRQLQLDAQTLAELRERVRALEANAALHVEDRGKGTGAFAVRDEAGERSFIIRRGPELLAFDELIAGLGR